MWESATRARERAIRTGTTIAAVLVLIGCGGSSVDPRRVEACEQFVAHARGLPCTTPAWEPSDWCTAQVASSPCDVASYYECLTEHTVCSGDLVDVPADAAQASCTLACPGTRTP